MLGASFERLFARLETSPENDRQRQQPLCRESPSNVSTDEMKRTHVAADATRTWNDDTGRRDDKHIHTDAVFPFMTPEARSQRRYLSRRQQSHTHTDRDRTSLLSNQKHHAQGPSQVHQPTQQRQDTGANTNSGEHSMPPCWKSTASITSMSSCQTQW